MEFRILGPLDVLAGDGPVPVGGGRQKALLALLVLHRNETVATDRIIEALWPGAAPTTANKVVQNHVSQLRRVFDEGRLQTTAAGYALRIDDGELDLDRFEALLAEGRTRLGRGELQEAAESLREALDLWRGPPLADLSYEPFAQADIARLEERRLTALEERIEADLALGSQSDLVAELEALVARHPLRERLRGQLMLALYRTGRQGEALQAYQDARRTLVDELGIEPGQALQRLHSAMLQQDPALDGPPRPEDDSPSAASARRDRLTGARLLAAGGLLLAVAAATALAVELTDGGSEASLAAIAGNAVGVIDPETNAVTGQVPVGGTPTSISVGEGAVWVLNADDQTISRIEPETRAVETFATGSSPSDLVAGEGALWVGKAGRATSLVAPPVAVAVAKIDPELRGARGSVALPAARGSVHNLAEDHLAVGAGSVWAVNPDFSVSRIDPRSRRLTVIRGVRALAITASAQAAWVLNDDNSVSRIDPRTNRPGRRVPVAATSLTDLAAGAGALWLAAPFDGVVWRVQTVPRVVMRTIDTGAGVDHVAFGDGAVWATNSLAGTVLRIDPATNRVTARIAIGNTPRNLAVGEGAVWVTVAGGPGEAVPAASSPPAGSVEALPRSFCEPVFYGGEGAPDHLIVSDLPLQGGDAFPTLQMGEAVAYVLRQHRFRAGRFRVGYQSCDDSTPQGPDPVKCTANAKAYAANPDVIGVVGPYNSGCAFQQLPFTNRASLATVAPLVSAQDLTRPGPSAPPGTFKLLYPTGRRHFARVVADDGAQGAANALLARDLGLESVFVLHDGDLLFALPRAGAFRRAARSLSVRIAGFRQWRPDARSYADLARAVHASGADGVFLAGGLYSRGGPLVRELRLRLGPQAVLMAPEFLPVASFFDEAGQAARGVYISLPGRVSEGLPARGRAFMREFAGTQPATVRRAAVYAAQATEALLAAVARSDGTRASVARELFGLRLRDGLLGDLRIDETGDVSPAAITVLRARAPGGSRVIEAYEGADVVRVIQPPARLYR